MFVRGSVPRNLARVLWELTLPALVSVPLALSSCSLAACVCKTALQCATVRTGQTPKLEFGLQWPQVELRKGSGTGTAPAKPFLPHSSVMLSKTHRLLASKNIEANGMASNPQARAPLLHHPVP